VCSLCLGIGLIFPQNQAQAATSNPKNTTRYNKVGFLLKGHREGFLDKVYSPLLMVGQGCGVGIRFAKEKVSSRHWVYIDYSRHPISPADKSLPETINYTIRGQSVPLSTYPAKTLYVGLRYDYHRLVKTIPKYWLKWYLGGAIDGSFHFYEAMAGYNDSWITSYALDLSTIVKYGRTCRQSFEVQLSTSLFSFVQRPPYSTSTDETKHSSTADYFTKTRPQGVDDNFWISSLMTYHHSVNCDLDLTLSYRLSYARSNQPRPVSIISHQIGFGITFLFRPAR